MKREALLSYLKSHSGGLLLLGAGFLYLIWIRLTGILIPCPFRLVTKIRCPGCGVTTMILQALKGDFRGAFYANPFLFLTSPYLLCLLLHEFRRTGSRTQGSAPGEKWRKRSEIVYLVLLLIFGLVRGAYDLYMRLP